MSESMSSPWIRDYFTEVAETYGTQLYNVPVSNKKKKVQLTDLLTYQENSYVWAWISDKDYRVPVRVSKDAVDRYKSNVHGRSVIDSRFFLVFVSDYRPMFSPRPLGLNVLGNTPVSHISLEIGFVSSIGAGGHLFGDPRDLESDESMKEWVLGLRQDGGGGNVLKLRKQQDLAQNEKALSPPLPSPLVSLSPAPQDQTTKAAKDVVEPKTERPQDFKRAYVKRWRKIEVHPWKFAFKPAVEKHSTQAEAEPDCPPNEQPLATASRLGSPSLSIRPTSHRTPSSFTLRLQGTPTDWSLSNWGSSPIPPDEAASGNGIQEHSEPEVSSAASHLASDMERSAIPDTVTTSDARSLQPPTPAQRIRRSLTHRSSSPTCSPPELFLCSSPHSSQQLPRSSPPLLSSSLPFPSSTLPTPMTEAEFDSQTGAQDPDTDKDNMDAEHEDIRSSIIQVHVHSTLQSQQHSHPATISATKHSSPKREDINGASTHNSTRSSELPESQGSMHSLFSDSLQDEQTVSLHVPTFAVGQTEDKVEEKADPADTPRHNPETWKEPTFIAKKKGKGKAFAVEELDALGLRASKKRRQSAQYESPVRKRTKVAVTETPLGTSCNATGILDPMQLQDTQTSTNRGIYSNDRPPTSPTNTTARAILSPTIRLIEPRLANFVVDFEKISLGKQAVIPRLDLENDIKGILLRTGRIRTRGEEVERDGSVHIMT